MSDDIPRYVRAPDTGDDRYWSDGRQFPFLLEDGHGRTDRLIAKSPVETPPLRAESFAY